MDKIVSSLCLLYMSTSMTFAATAKYVGIDLYTLQTSTLNNVFPRSAANGIVVGQAVPVGDFNNHAFLWSGPQGEAVDLQQPGSYTSIAWATDGERQVGVGDIGALLWQGSVASSIELHPTNHSGIVGSRAFGVGGTQQVGSMDGPGTGSKFHAVLWNSSADSAIDLHPTNLNHILESTALSTNGVQQVGNGLNWDGYRRALLWNGTASSAVDLHPPSFNGLSDESEALGVGGSQQVGRVGGTSTNGRNHAFLWTGSAASAIDLHPTLLTGFFDTFALATNGQNQVGYGGIVPNSSDFSHALVWSGTAESTIDLHTSLPPVEFGAGTSRAMSIDSQGNIFGIAQDKLARFHAVMWVAIPEPATMVLAIGVMAMLAMKRKGAVR
jgi:hypothetical protein